MQAEIGQNRSIFPTRTKRPESIVTNGVTETRRLRCVISAMGPAEDVQEDACRCNAGAVQTSWARPRRAQSLYGGTMWQAPPCELTLSVRTGCVAWKEATHPITSFDNNDLGTLERFASRTGRPD
jgi:hypothetical protein